MFVFYFLYELLKQICGRDNKKLNTTVKIIEKRRGQGRKGGYMCKIKQWKAVTIQTVETCNHRPYLQERLCK